jgi:hypothetical protein
MTTPESLFQERQIEICNILSRMDPLLVHPEQIEQWIVDVTGTMCKDRSAKFTTKFIRILRNAVADAIKPDIEEQTSNSVKIAPMVSVSHTGQNGNNKKYYDPAVWVTAKIFRDDWPRIERLKDRYNKQLVSPLRIDLVD